MMVEPRDAAGGHDVECDVELVGDMKARTDERRLRPLEWLSDPASRSHDLQAWLDYRSTMIGSARAERWRR